MTTFAELGTTFPLFEAPVEDARDVAGPGECALCHRPSTIRFSLGYGCHILVDCPACGVRRALKADLSSSNRCRSCGTDIPHPGADDATVCCVGCIREGRATIFKETEVGMITWDEAQTGVTWCLAPVSHPDFEYVQYGDGSAGVSLDPGHMQELLRTPEYKVFTGASWLFCCRQPMVFVGNWSRQRFDEEAPDGNGKALFAAIVEANVNGLWEDTLGEPTLIHVFRCEVCKRHRANWDVRSRK